MRALAIDKGASRIDYQPRRKELVFISKSIVIAMAAMAGDNVTRPLSIDTRRSSSDKGARQSIPYALNSYASGVLDADYR